MIATMATPSLPHATSHGLAGGRAPGLETGKLPVRERGGTVERPLWLTWHCKVVNITPLVGGLEHVLSHTLGVIIPTD